MKKVVVIGAGPAGLSAAYKLLKESNEYEVIILEGTKDIGGISKTVKYKGNRMDIGGHRFFSKNKSKSSKVFGSYFAAIICPVVNTGIFLLAMFTIFKPQLVEISGGTGIVYFAFVMLAGLNFLIEVAVNVILAPVIVAITNAIKSSRKR